MLAITRPSVPLNDQQTQEQKCILGFLPVPSLCHTEIENRKRIKFQSYTHYYCYILREIRLLQPIRVAT